MKRHRIRLRGPWEAEWVSDNAVRFTKVRLPGNWNELVGGHWEGGSLRLTRRFHRPTNLAPDEQVELVFQNWPGRWIVRLNSRQVGEIEDCHSPRTVAVTEFLQPTNAVTLETQVVPAAVGASVPDAPFGDMALEIHEH